MRKLRHREASKHVCHPSAAKIPLIWMGSQHINGEPSKAKKPLNREMRSGFWGDLIG